MPQYRQFDGSPGQRQNRTPGSRPRSLGPSGYDDAMIADPVNVTAALASFDEIYSPRIVARMNDYDVRVAHTRGEHVWHVHEDTDEFFLVIEGRFDVAIREPDGTQTTVTLRKGDTFVVPKGTEHKPSSPGGSILMFEPSGTSTTGDRHEGSIPDHVDSTTGHPLTSRPNRGPKPGAR
jgi:mannose-6-phosphate isomerase-like protein (cupin superfamily)